MKRAEKTYNQLAKKTKTELIEEIFKLKNGNNSSKKTSISNFSESDNLSKLIVENSNDAIIIVGDNFIIEYVNKRVEELFDVKSKELVGSDFTSFLDFKTKNYLKEKHKSQRDGRSLDSSFELQINTAQNELKLFEIRTTVFEDPRGDFKTLAQLKDVTEKKIAEEAIKQSEEKFRSIVENSHLGIFMLNTEYQFEYVNDQCCKILESSKEKLIGQDFRKVVAKESLELVVERYRKRQSGISVPSEYEIKLVRDGGEERIVKLSSSIVRLNNNIKTMAQVLDITESVRKEKLEKTLLNISQAVNEVKNLPEFLNIVRIELSAILDTTNFYIALYDENSDTYTFPFHVDEYDVIDNFTQIELKDSLTDYVRRKNLAILVNAEMQTILEKEGEIKGIVGEYCPVWLGAPLVVDNVVVGAICMQNYHTEDAFSNYDLEVLKIISENVSSAIWRKLIVDKLTESEMRYKDFISRSSEGIYRIDFKEPIDISLPVEKQVDLIVRTSCIAECNDILVKMYGYRESSQLIGKSLLDFYGNNFKRGDVNYKTNQLFVQNDYTIVNSLTEELNLKGEKVHISNNSVGVVKDGYLVHVWGIQADITEKKKVEDVLRQIAEGVHTNMDESFFKSVVTFLGRALNVNFAVIAQVNEQQEIANTIACWDNNKIGDNFDFEIKNTPSEIVLTNGEADYYDNVSKIFKKDSFLQKKSFEGYMGRVLKDSHNNVVGLIYILFKNKIEKSELIKSVLNIFASKTSAEIERLKYENELVDAKNEAERSNSLKTDFLAQMSHEIRTPVNTILSFSSLLKESLEDKLDEDLKESFTIIDKGGRRLIRTIDLILNVSQLQSGNLVLSPTNHDLIGILKDLVSEFKPSATNKGLNLIFETREENLIILADLYTITQIFANLIHNAIKYTTNGTIKIRATKNKSGKISVRVKDTGVGMSDIFLNKIFDPFSQEETGYTRKFEGTGLGLTLVRKYCELNNAKINVKSVKNGGSTFIISFNNNGTR